MVEAPNGYMLQAQFLEALCDPLRWEVLRQGHSAKFSKMSELIFAAEQIEDTSHYNWWVPQVDVSSSNTAAQTKPVPPRAWATYTPWPYIVQGQRPRAVCQEWILGSLKSKSIEFKVVSNVDYTNIQLESKLSWRRETIQFNCEFRVGSWSLLLITAVCIIQGMRLFILKKKKVSWTRYLHQFCTEWSESIFVILPQK